MIWFVWILEALRDVHENASANEVLPKRYIRIRDHKDFASVYKLRLFVKDVVHANDEGPSVAAVTKRCAVQVVVVEEIHIPTVHAAILDTKAGIACAKSVGEGLLC